ncbi:MAG: hypothetical protein AAB488_00140 [Patescibacteria group bacterium]
MEIAIVAMTGESVLGQSLGCVIPLNPRMRLHATKNLALKLKGGETEGRVDTVIASSIPISGIKGPCLSIAFHLPGLGFLSKKSMQKRAHIIANWVRKEFGVEKIYFVTYESRQELAHSLCIGKTVIM